METARTLRGNLRYVKQLTGAGWTGLWSAATEFQGPVFSPPLQHAAWAPMAAGAALGMMGARYSQLRAKKNTVALGGVVGTALGLVAVVAWASRRVTRAAARKAIRRINDVRDARWLELNPIDYA